MAAVFTPLIAPKRDLGPMVELSTHSGVKRMGKPSGVSMWPGPTTDITLTFFRKLRYLVPWQETARLLLVGSTMPVISTGPFVGPDVDADAPFLGKDGGDEYLSSTSRG